VLRFLRLVGYPRGIRIYASRDHGTHWLLKFAVPSIENPGRIFTYASVVAEKGTGYVYSFPSRARQPIDAADIASVRQGCTRVTSDDLDRLEAEVGSRSGR
jgi:hypothetical protein